MSMRNAMRIVVTDTSIAGPLGCCTENVWFPSVACWPDNQVFEHDLPSVSRVQAR